MPVKSQPAFPESAAVAGERRQIARQEFGMRREILDILKGGSKTVPEVAQALGISTRRATWWLMGYVRYGAVRASEKANDDGYFLYSLVQEK
jgi:hypothetical protein